MKVLLFGGKFQRHPGLNFTVREGSTWSKIVSPGDIVRLGKTPLHLWSITRDSTHGDSGIPGVAYETVIQQTRVARIVHLIRCQLKNVPEFVLQDEHDPNCRTWLGLVSKLQDIYGPHIDVDTEVTCVGYRVLEEI